MFFFNHAYNFKANGHIHYLKEKPAEWFEFC